jgi:hypothetical protein
MKKIFRYALLSAFLGILITIGTGFINRDYSYDVSICSKEGNSHLFPGRLGSVTIDYESAGLPWTFKDYEPKYPVASTCPVPDNVWPLGNSLSNASNRIAFIFDFLFWSAIVFGLIYIIGRKKHKGSNKNK